MDKTVALAATADHLANAAASAAELYSSPNATPQERDYAKRLVKFSNEMISEASTLHVVSKSAWSAADMNDLPDSAFLHIEPGGSKDSGGKTTPRSLRHFPVRSADGKLDLPHLRNALGRIPQSSLSSDVKHRVSMQAEKLLSDANQRG